MNIVNFKTKVVFLVATPLLISSALLILLPAFQYQQLWQKNTDVFAEKLYDIRRAELKNYTQLASSAIDHLYTTSDSDMTKETALTILRDLKYGDNGYFFVFDYDGKSLVHPTKPHLEGRELLSLQDVNGQFVIQSIIRQAKNDLGGYSDYLWEKPTLGREMEKISFSVGLNQWRWAIGTGAYKDDIAANMLSVENAIVENSKQAFVTTIVLSLLITALIALIAVRFTVSQCRLASNRLKKLSSICVDEREDERDQVAKRLQTDVAGGIQFSQKVLSSLSSDPLFQSEEAQKSMVLMNKALQKTLKNVSGLRNDLRSQTLVDEGICAGIQELIDSASEKEAIAFKLTTVDRFDRPNLHVEQACYHMVSEALDNIVQHSEAKEANIRLRQSSNLLSITIQDDGIGFDPKPVMAGLRCGGAGLPSMQLRTELLNGLFSLFSAKGTGTIIKIGIPY